MSTAVLFLTGLKKLNVSTTLQRTRDVLKQARQAEPARSTR